MLQTLLNDWKGDILINDIVVEASKIDCTAFSDDTHIILRSATKNATEGEIERKNDTVQSTTNDVQQYKITVKRYMTETASPDFDFMAKWNNDVPMPLRTMVGTVEKETKGMVYMKLHGQAEPVIKCMRCGRTLTNEVSRLYGIGPECITKIPFVMDLDINDVDNIKQKLVDVVWEGWIIKSAIIEKEDVSC